MTGQLKLINSKALKGQEETRCRQFTMAPKSRRIDHDSQFGRLATDHAGQVWAATLSGMLMRKQRPNGRFEAVARLSKILDLFVDGSGRLWICTNKGLYLIASPATDSRPQKVSLDGLQSPGDVVEVTGACQTVRGTLWFLVNGRLFRMHEGRWTHPELGTSQDTTLGELVCDGDSLWLTGQSDTAVWKVAADARSKRLMPHSLELERSPLRGRRVQSTFVDQRHCHVEGRGGPSGRCSAGDNAVPRL